MSEWRRDFAREREIFQLIVGRAIFAMGNIEFQTIFAIDCLGAWKHKPTLRRMTLSQRLQFLKELVSDRADDIKSPVDTFVRESLALLPRRNVIAHSPLAFLLDDETNNDHFVFQSLRSDEMLYVKDVEAFAVKAEAVSQAFNSHFEKLTTPPPAQTPSESSDAAPPG